MNLRAIRLGPSDAFIFPAAAEPGEWAIPGVLAFYGVDLAALVGEERSAFGSGFLGVGSLAWSTLVQVVASTPDDRSATIELLAQRLLDRLSAPDRVAARMAAGEEIDFAASLCNHPVDLIAMHRSGENGAIRETFRALRPRRSAPPMRAFSFHKNEDGAGETVDLVTLARGDPRRGAPE
jgi:hypothetical protein